jgi:hypothetical protein
MRFFFILFLFSAHQTFACQIQRIGAVNLAISHTTESTVYYNEERTIPNLPQFRASNCSQAAMNGQFLMIAMGPEVIDYEDTVKGVNFTKDFGYKKCELTGHPFVRANDHEVRKEKFNQDWKLIQSCLEITVEDEGNQPLQLPTKQPGCDLQRISTHKMSFNGGFCFVKPNFASSYLLKLQIKKQCQNLESFSKLGINNLDLFGAINLYLAGDASGNSGNLRALSNLPIRLSVNPQADIVASSDDYGIEYPTFPENWSMPDIHFGKVNLIALGNGMLQIETQMLVNNNCPKVCKKDICQSACDYAQPVVAENSLYEKTEKGLELITTWYDGGIAPARFQGFIKGIGFEIAETMIDEGKTYVIESNLYDPKYDYERFKKRIQSRLNTIEQQIGRISNSSIPTIQEIPRIHVTRELPGISTIPGLVFERNLDNVERAVEQLRSYLSFKLWPPYFAQVCHDGSCDSIKDPMLTLKAEFKVSLKTYEHVKLDIKSIKRESYIVPKYEMNNLHQLEIKCE